MYLTQEQKRACVLCWNGIVIWFLTFIYDMYEPKEYSSVLYYRRAFPVVALGLVLWRLVNYGQHVFVDDCAVYSYDPGTGEHTIREEIKTYRTLLVGSYVVVAVVLVFEVWVQAEIVILASLACICGLQVAETWAYWDDLNTERDLKVRPRSPHQVV